MDFVDSCRHYLRGARKKRMNLGDGEDLEMTLLRYPMAFD